QARPDVVAWRTGPLAEGLTVLGAVRAVVHLVTTGTDTDVVVRLCDEHPDGSTRLVADGAQRASPLPVDPVTGLGERRAGVPGQELEVVVDLSSTAHTFLPGDRVRADIAPSAAPRWEAGRNAFDADGTAARPAAADYTIRHGAARPSRLVLQVAAT